MRQVVMSQFETERILILKKRISNALISTGTNSFRRINDDSAFRINFEEIAEDSSDTFIVSLKITVRTGTESPDEYEISEEDIYLELTENEMRGYLSETLKGKIADRLRHQLQNDKYKAEVAKHPNSYLRLEDTMAILEKLDNSEM